MLTCKQVSQLVSESMEQKLSLRLRMAVRLHLMMCSMCRTYKRQTLQLRNAVQIYVRHESPEHLSEDASQRIKKELKKEM